MSSTIIIVFCLRVIKQARCHLAAVLVLVLPDIVHFLHLQHLHHENHNELRRTGVHKQETEIRLFSGLSKKNIVSIKLVS